MDADSNLGSLISVSFNKYINNLNVQFEKMNLNTTQARVLLILSKNNNVSIDYISKESFISKSSVTKAVKTLESNGFLTKRINPEDNRKKIVTITEKGKEVKKAAIETNKKIEDELKAKIGEEELINLKKSLAKLLESI